MFLKSVRCNLLLLLVLSLCGCASQQYGSRSSIVDYLYPNTEQVQIEPSIPTLNLPLRVGVAFVPAEPGQRQGHNNWGSSATGPQLTEPAKLKIMEQIANHFRDKDYIGDIQVIPSAYLRPQGSFANLQQLQSMFGIDVIALVSFDQIQFSDERKAALSYWTLIGAYLVAGQKNDTSTLMDTAVYDIRSRKLLFRAPGISNVKGRSTPVNLAEELRQDSQQGFTEASTQMISNLEQELRQFSERLKAKPDDIKVVRSSQYKGGSLNSLLLLLGMPLLYYRRRMHLLKSPTAVTTPFN